MDIHSVNKVQGPHDGNTKNDSSESVLAGEGKQGSPTDKVEGQKIYKGDTNVHENVGFGDVNMEASISADDVIRAGGFGARDDISSFLPVASDSTDFEASLSNARDYEEPQRDICRPGLGWKDVKK